MKILSFFAVARYLSIVLIILGMSAGGAVAQNKVIVIPLMNSQGKTLKNVVTVAKANGDFTDPVAAVASITDATAANPYLVVIGPGEYTLSSTLMMKPYVAVAGSGRAVTILTGAVSTASFDHTSSLVFGAMHSELTDLAVENTGGSDNSIGIFNYAMTGNAQFVMSRLIIYATGGALRNYGVLNDGASPDMKQVEARGIGHGRWCVGIYNKNSAFPRMRDIQAWGYLGNDNSIGILNSNASPRMDGIVAFGSGSDLAAGIYNDAGSSPVIKNISARGYNSQIGNYGVYNNNSDPLIRSSELIGGPTGGGPGYGVYNEGTSAPQIDGSTLEGTATGAGVRINGTGVRLSNSMILNGIKDNPAGTTQCQNIYDENFNGIGC